ncbi:hypothetical protein VTL71DRAFT_8816 [Oculimacula yallundae]|uniref:Uncharacterized protein n=1 Tax=Oculimacula yallundae TaxID=86028 RepID=A0ABR4CZU6_9HELO
MSNTGAETNPSPAELDSNLVEAMLENEIQVKLALRAPRAGNDHGNTIEGARDKCAAPPLSFSYENSVPESTGYFDHTPQHPNANMGSSMSTLDHQDISIRTPSVSNVAMIVQDYSTQVELPVRLPSREFRDIASAGSNETECEPSFCEQCQSKDTTLLRLQISHLELQEEYHDLQLDLEEAPKKAAASNEETITALHQVIDIRAELEEAQGTIESLPTKKAHNDLREINDRLKKELAAERHGKAMVEQNNMPNKKNLQERVVQLGFE